MKGDLRFTFKLASVVIALLLSLSVGTVYAATLNDLRSTENKLNQTRKNIRSGVANKKRLNSEIKTSDEQLGMVESQLDKINGNLNDVRKAKNAVTTKLNKLRAELAETQVELDKALARLKELTKTLGLRAGNVYKNGDISFIEVLFEARDFRDFITRARLLQTIINLDAKLVRDIKQTKAKIEATRAAIEHNRIETQKQEDALSVEINRLAKLVSAQKAKRDEVKTQISAKEQMISKIEQDREAWLAAEAEFARSAARIREKLSRSSGTPVVGNPSAKGFIWPAAGPVTSSFGPRWGRMHEGIDISVGYGSPVVASKTGRVAIAEWYGGYGKLVVIDHGGGATTWYGHNSSFTANVGQRVSQGQVIARAGSTGNSTGPHVHFEVQINGNPKNPISYLP